jgi:hypothetical protein
MLCILLTVPPSDALSSSARSRAAMSNVFIFRNLGERALCAGVSRPSSLSDRGHDFPGDAEFVL